MIDDTFVLDSVVHAYNFSMDNRLVAEPTQQLAEMLYHGFHSNFSPRGQPQWIQSEESFLGEPNVDLLAHALFAESQTDACIYHEVPGWGYWKDGGSPLWVGKEMQKRWPGRVHLYGGISPWQPNALDQIDKLVDEDKVVGIKLYPMDIVDGELRDYRLDDPEIAFPIFEKILSRGLRMVAFHKALPLGRVRSKPFEVDDVDDAARAFPDLTFEVVHGGFAFLEQTASLVARFPNVVINLEGTNAFLVNAPRKFQEIMGTFLSMGAEDRIIWATGCEALHPKPMLDAFWAMTIPQDLQEGYGFPEITQVAKQKILGGNHARLLGLDLNQMRGKHSGDEFDTLSGLAAPWSGGGQ